jgi:hypothetical protein
VKVKVIFLDIDGVLNSETFYKEKSQEERCNAPSKFHFYEHMIDEMCIKLLNELVRDTDAKVVISSTWRLSWCIKDLEKMFKIRGFEYEIFGKTPSLSFNSNCNVKTSVSRGAEIREWIERQNRSKGDYVDKYVIFDDDSDMLLSQSENYFRVDDHYGLTPNLIYKAKRYLNNERL